MVTLADMGAKILDLGNICGFTFDSCYSGLTNFEEIQLMEENWGILPQKVIIDFHTFNEIDSRNKC